MRFRRLLALAVVLALVLLPGDDVYGGRGRGGGGGGRGGGYRGGGFSAVWVDCARNSPTQGSESDKVGESAKLGEFRQPWRKREDGTRSTGPAAPRHGSLQRHRPINR